MLSTFGDAGAIDSPAVDNTPAVTADPAAPDAERARLEAAVTGKYRIDALIGRGLFSTVFRATEIRGAAEVALKLLDAGVRTTPEILDQLEAGQRACAALADEGVVAASAVEHRDSTTFLVMSLMHGGSLTQNASLARSATAARSDQHRERRGRDAGPSARRRHHAPRIDSGKHPVRLQRSPLHRGHWHHGFVACGWRTGRLAHATRACLRGARAMAHADYRGPRRSVCARADRARECSPASRPGIGKRWMAIECSSRSESFPMHRCARAFRCT